MGRSDPYLNDFYRARIFPKGELALLGFTQQGKFGLQGDLYDYQLGNWEINSDWSLKKKYDTIVCLRCSFFAKEPEKFIEKCFDNLEENGLLVIDWGYGHHWTGQGFEFKVGWVKNGIQEHAYFDNNFLWSGVWCDEFLKHPEFIQFEKSIKELGYSKNIKNIIFDETPKVVQIQDLSKEYHIKYDIMTLWDNRMIRNQIQENMKSQILEIQNLEDKKQTSRVEPQCYILMSMRKK
mgnify:CR=1 FL=1